MLQFKLVLLGDSSVGKSSIVQRFVKNSFDENRESTIGAAFLSQTIKIKPSTSFPSLTSTTTSTTTTNPEDNEVAIKFEIWDTAGQERYKSLAPMYYRNANAAIIVYDITQKDSLQKAVKWVDELKSKLGEDSDVIISLIGNKLDLVTSSTNTDTGASAVSAEDTNTGISDELEGNRQVQEDEASEYAVQNGLLFHEVSAKTSQGINEIFQEIGENLYNLHVEKTKGGSGNGVGGSGNGRNGVNIELNRPSTNDPTSCCS
ncbi:hypothetical protein ACO0QE_004139 [Hanseniaspora vineae]